jgi:hypothetical protein
MSAGQSGPERIAEMVRMLAVTGEALGGLVAKISSATAAEMPALDADAKASIEEIVRCCTETSPVAHPPSEIAEMMLADLISLGDALRERIAGLLTLRWAQIAAGGARATSRTRH